MRRLNNRGLTILELMICIGMLGLCSYCITFLVRGSLRLTTTVTPSVTAAETAIAVDVIQRDLREAKFASFPFTTLQSDPYGLPGWFSCYSSDSASTRYVRYDVETLADKPNMGRLLRRENAQAPQVSGSSQTIILSEMRLPGSDALFLQRHSTLPMLTLTLLVRASGSTGNVLYQRYVRRATLRS
jgi:hypothetical protein